MATPTTLRTATVIGCGTRGLAVAFALRGAGVEVHLLDTDPRVVARAQELGAGGLRPPGLPAADVVVVATPAATVVDVLYEAQARGLGRAYTDIAATDTKEAIGAEARLRGCDLLGYVPGNPLIDPDHVPHRPTTAADGPFTGRTWILCPYEDGDPAATAAVDALLRLCGAHRRDLTPAQHDRAVAAPAHTPAPVATAPTGPRTGATPPSGLARADPCEPDRSSRFDQHDPASTTGPGQLSNRGDDLPPGPLGP
ncbi:prephenate dehydrogenase/arogenate dehydrogenase family protein [Streptomyces sp. NPDC014734]|uniref:prephenate dehydrogenase/arogenate dehydrogenase family protein n=1 Tax=Streptomyces sp. NPDC014734 TaxID=3364886 RepID=UPI0037017627